MIVSGVTKNNGDLLDISCLVILLGYQILHKVTGRRLPQTVDFEIYTAHAAMSKLGEVGEFFEDEPDFDVLEYEFVPIYDFEMESGWIQITHQKDW